MPPPKPSVEFPEIVHSDTGEGANDEGRSSCPLGKAECEREGDQPPGNFCAERSEDFRRKGFRLDHSSPSDEISAFSTHQSHEMESRHWKGHVNRGDREQGYSGFLSEPSG